MNDLVMASMPHSECIKKNESEVTGWCESLRNTTTRGQVRHPLMSQIYQQPTSEMGRIACDVSERE